MARNQNQATGNVDRGPEYGRVPFKWFDGSEGDFESLPLSTQRYLVQKAVTRLEAEAATGARVKARTALFEEAGGTGKKGDIRDADIVATFIDEGAPRRHDWDSWQNGLMAQFRDTALAGELGFAAPTVSQTQKDRVEAMTRTITEVVANKNRARIAQGQKPIVFLLPIKHGKGVADENVAIKVRNESKVLGELAKVDSGTSPFADMFNGHLAAVVSERTAKAYSAGDTSEELDDLGDDLRQAAE